MLTYIKKYLNQERIWLKLSYTFRWAHHPTCNRYSNQRFDLFGISFCQGCTLIVLGAIIGLIVGLIFSLTNIISLGIILASTILIVAIVDGLSMSRTFKRATRLSMGFSSGLIIYQLLTQSWPVRLILILGFLGLWNVYRYFRSISPSKNLCIDCEELVLSPKCSGIRSKYEANLTYMELVLPVIDDTKIRELERMQDISMQQSSINRD